MHVDVGTAVDGDMARSVTELSKSVAAFFTDLGTESSRVTVVTISEFGRRVEENSSLGLDHGYGNVMFLHRGRRERRPVLRAVAGPGVRTSLSRVTLR